MLHGAFTMACLAASASFAWSQDWSLQESGFGILDTASTPPTAVDRDRPEWFAESLQGQLTGKRQFMFWVAGPRPETYRNKGGVPIYGYTFRYSKNGAQAHRGGTYSFTEAGWGTQQMPTEPGTYRYDILLVNSENGSERLLKTFTYTIKPGKGGSTPPSSGGADVYLSDLPESASGNVHGGLGKDRPYWASELVIAGRRFAKGLVTHAPAENGRKAFVEYALGGQYRLFQATLGSAADKSNYGDGSMNYAVLVDGRVVDQGRFPVPPATKGIQVSLQGARTLRLEVDNGGNGNNADHAAWGDARLTR